jgi:hypothetical protein
MMAAPAPVPTPAPEPHPAGAEHHEDLHTTDPTAESDIGAVKAAAGYVATQSDMMTSQLEARSEDYANQLKIALTNHTGKDQEGHNLKGPALKESKHIVEEFKAYAHSTRHDMEGFQGMSIDPSSTQRIAKQIIDVAGHLDSNFAESQHHLDELFERTYAGIRDGKRTLKSRVLDGDNFIGDINRAGDRVEDKVDDTVLPAANTAWDKVVGAPPK